MNKDPLINLAIQVLPTSETRKVYDMVDDAIAIIKDSGVKHVVCPFETVMEGTYNRLMEVVKKVHGNCLEQGADEVLINIKIQSNRFKDVLIEDKTGKYNK